MEMPKNEKKNMFMSSLPVSWKESCYWERKFMSTSTLYSTKAKDYWDYLFVIDDTIMQKYFEVSSSAGKWEFRHKKAAPRPKHLSKIYLVEKKFC